MLAAIAALSTAVIITPASAAVGLHHIEGGTVAAVFLVGIVAFALFFQAIHLSRAKATTRSRRAQD